MRRIKTKHKRRGDQAISDIVGLILVLGIVTSSITITLVWGLPYLESRKAYSQLNNVYNQFEFFDVLLYDLTREGRQSGFDEYSITIESGQISFPIDKTTFIVWYSLAPEGECVLDVNNFIDDDTKFDITNAVASSITIKSLQFTWLDTSVIENKESIPDPIDPGDTYNALLGDSPSDTMLVKLYSSATIDENNLVAKIWRFKISTLEYKKQTSAGDYATRLENNGIIFQTGGSFYLKKQPVVYDNNEIDEKSIDMILNFISLTPSDSTGGSGGGEYIFSGALNQQKLYESKQQVNDIYILVDGTYKSSWYYFLKNTYEFDTTNMPAPGSPAEEDVSYKITIIYSDINIELEGIV